MNARPPLGSVKVEIAPTPSGLSAQRLGLRAGLMILLSYVAFNKSACIATVLLDFSSLGSALEPLGGESEDAKVSLTSLNSIRPSGGRAQAWGLPRGPLSLRAGGCVQGGRPAPPTGRSVPGVSVRAASALPAAVPAARCRVPVLVPSVRCLASLGTPSVTVSLSCLSRLGRRQSGGRS